MTIFRAVPLTELVDVHDHLREPVSQTERNKRQGKYPYYGATGQVGWIDDYKQNGKYVLLGEDGAPFLDPQKPKAYIVEGKCWVNNHAHVLKGKEGICDDDYLCFALNWANYSDAVTGSTRLKLPQGAMNRILIPKVPIEQQRRIAARLKAQLAEVDTARQSAQAQLRDASFLQRRLLQASFAQVEGKPTTLGHVLSGIQTGKSFLTAEVMARPDELGVLKVSAVSWSHFRADQAKALRGEYTPAEIHRVKQGDLLISRANTRELVGAVVLVERDYQMRLLSDKTLRLIVDESLADKNYLLFALRTELARQHIELYATGTSDSMRNISQDVIASTPILLPPLDEQQRIVTRLKAQLAEADALAQAAAAQLTEIERLPQRLLAQAFEN